jgi:hypothetical protein
MRLLGVDDASHVVSPAASTTPRQPTSTTTNLFVIGSPHEEVEGITVEVDPVRDIATHMRAEIERIFALSEPFVPA